MFARRSRTGWLDPARSLARRAAGGGGDGAGTPSAAQEELLRQKDLYEALLQAQSDVGEAVLILDGDRIVYANQACEEITGYPAHELLDLESLLEIVPAEEREALRTRMAQRLRDNRVEPAYETRIVRKDGHLLDVELAAKALSEDGRGRLVLVGRDITERKRTEELRTLLLQAEREARAQAEEAEQRSLFLAEATGVLEASLDLATTARSVARLCVPFLGHLCTVDLMVDGRIQRIAVVASDPEKERLVEEIQRRWPIDPGPGHPLAEVVRTGRTQVIPEVTDELLGGIARDEEHLAMLRQVRFGSAVTAPIRARGRTFGAISVGRFPPGGPYDTRDVTLLEELAVRAGLAIDNARLYEERASVARTLQRSLLPPRLPEVPGVDLAARYRAAGAGNEVGGDFYDVFDTGETWALVIGDVCGKGPAAAAITSLARYTLRAAAMHRTRPSTVLGVLNEALLRQETEGQFSSVIYAQLRANGGDVDLTLCCGGHPLPLVLRSDGRVESAGEPGTLLGIGPEPRLVDAPVHLVRGDALVLYTDGVIEARTGSGLFGPERLAELVAGQAGRDAHAVAEAIETTAVEVQEGEPRDDIAVVVVRVP